MYAQRSGIEGTHSQAVRTLGLRRTRYRGLEKTALQHMLTAAAINLVRLDAFLDGKRATRTRTSRFAALHPALASEWYPSFASGIKFGMTHVFCCIFARITV
ncbi:hypothetical protein KSF_003070 [Reticulibacter mediterranei]|uniref:Transposase DDE domain-containing protein n=1 Tax=Reticulibacter mediterranei TaxID=2778369 RepID=A0A8J3IFG9_9CHLR|nr:hypothetical protein KSF_003070 [Reticulibacter mediterranei]